MSDIKSKYIIQDHAVVGNFESSKFVTGDMDNISVHVAWSDPLLACDLVLQVSVLPNVWEELSRVTLPNGESSQLWIDKLASYSSLRVKVENYLAGAGEIDCLVLGKGDA